MSACEKCWRDSAGDDLEYRFFLRVEKTDSCWLWTGPIKEKGYGKFSIGRSGVRAHRWLWQHLNGPLDPKIELRHKCDVRHCVNPDHLEIGSHAQNMADMTSRGRQAIGLKIARGRLSDDDVRKARTRYQGGEAIASIARSLNMSSPSMSRIVRGLERRHVK